MSLSLNTRRRLRHKLDAGLINPYRTCVACTLQAGSEWLPVSGVAFAWNSGGPIGTRIIGSWPIVPCLGIAPAQSLLAVVYCGSNAEWYGVLESHIHDEKLFEGGGKDAKAGP